MASPLNSINRSILRLSGLSSGLDTDSIVKSLLKIDQFKVDKQYKYKTKLEWKSEAYREVNLLLRNFRENNMSALTPSTNMLSTSAYKQYSVTMLNTTNAVAVSAGSKATPGIVTIDSITNLAEAAQFKSEGIVNGEISLDTALEDLAFNTPLEFDANGEISFTINGEDFIFNRSNTLNDIITSVNARTAAGVIMSYSSLKKGFIITAKDTGLASTIEIENVAGNAFAAGNAAFGIEAGIDHGEDAVLSINNTEVRSSTNNFTIDGISYSLKAETDTPISFNVERDIDATFNKIKGFIDNYNKLIDSLQAKLDEEVYRDYEALTDEERELLTETQQKQWEEKAKSGLLRGDKNIERLLSQMRSAFYTAVTDAGLSPMEIGLKTGAYRENGRINIDDAKLREALENNPDGVAMIFAKTSKATDSGVKFKESGLVTRISDLMSQYTETAISVTLENNKEAISDAEDRLEQLKDWLSNNEEKYWARFTAMETALARMNSQSSWLAAQMGSFGNKG